MSLTERNNNKNLLTLTCDNTIKFLRRFPFRTKVVYIIFFMKKIILSLIQEIKSIMHASCIFIQIGLMLIFKLAPLNN